MASTEQKTWRAALIFAGGAVIAQYLFGSGPIVAPTSSSLEACLNDVCAGRDDCVRFGNTAEWAQPFNLGQSSVPAAVIRPKDAQEIAGVVKCALKHDTKVQAKAGGHGFGNHGLGGEDGAISVDMHHFQYTSVDMMTPSRNVRVGGGTRLGQIDEHLRAHQRVIPHGLCGGIGIGGHATVGGIGPMSRMWGTTLDHVEEVEVVTANGTVTRASNHHNSDLFFALRGAGAGFGIVTEFVMKTHPAPEEVFFYTNDLKFSNLDDKVEAFHSWQTLVADPTLDNRLGTDFTLTPSGVRISATWYGSWEELHQSNIMGRLPAGGAASLSQETWDSSIAKNAAEESRHLSASPGKFFSKGLGFTPDDILSRPAIAELFESLESQAEENSWSIRFQAVGGAISEVPTGATAFAHRDKFMFYQSYAAGDCKTTKNFLENFHREILNIVPTEATGTYPGFVDTSLRDAQESYWQGNVPALEQIKTVWDPKDVFHNPQSIRPITA
ncbi:FAD-linked oxidoreductase sorD [Colletotrichum siamense]|nr:FAD-linked oxidoreductase sorD [Colletotrichum siamense]